MFAHELPSDKAPMGLFLDFNSICFPFLLHFLICFSFALICFSFTLICFLLFIGHAIDWTTDDVQQLLAFLGLAQYGKLFELEDGRELIETVTRGADEFTWFGIEQRQHRLLLFFAILCNIKQHK